MLLNGAFLWGLLGYISPSFSLAGIFIDNLVNHFLSSEPSDLIPVGVSFDYFFCFLVGAVLVGCWPFGGAYAAPTGRVL